MPKSSESNNSNSNNSHMSNTISLDGHQVKLTHPDKILWPDDGISKRDLVDYYVRIAPYLLPHIQDRPLTLKPYPDGIDAKAFFIRTRPAYAPDWLETATYTPEHGREGTIYPPVANDAATLAWMANHAVIEIHPWLAKCDDIYRPDLVVFDLDAPPAFAYSEVLAVGSELIRLLETMRLRTFAKTSGKSGLHLFIPIARRYSFPETRQFAEQIGIKLQERLPDKVTTDYTQYQNEAERRLIIVDYSQNSVAKSTVGPYSLRPVRGAPVSTPLSLEEVRSGKFDPARYTITTIYERLAEHGDLWQDLPGLEQQLPELG